MHTLLLTTSILVLTIGGIYGTVLTSTRKAPDALECILRLWSLAAIGGLLHCVDLSSTELDAFNVLIIINTVVLAMGIAIRFFSYAKTHSIDKAVIILAATILITAQF